MRDGMLKIESGKSHIRRYEVNKYFFVVNDNKSIDGTKNEMI